MQNMLYLVFFNACRPLGIYTRRSNIMSLPKVLVTRKDIPQRALDMLKEK